MELIDALDEDDIDAVRILLDAGADPNSTYVISHDYTEEIILDTVSSAADLRILALLLSHGADPNLNRSKALIHAANVGNLAVIKLLVSQGAKDLDRALIHAVHYNHPAITSYLLSQGADPRRRYEIYHGTMVNLERGLDAALILLDAYPSLRKLDLRVQKRFEEDERIRSLLAESTLTRLISRYL